MWNALWDFCSYQCVLLYQKNIQCPSWHRNKRFCHTEKKKTRKAGLGLGFFDRISGSSDCFVSTSNKAIISQQFILNVPHSLPCQQVPPVLQQLLKTFYFPVSPTVLRPAISIKDSRCLPYTEVVCKMTRRPKCSNAYRPFSYCQTEWIISEFSSPFYQCLPLLLS